MEKWLREEVGRRRCSADEANGQHGGAAGRATVGGGRREKQDEGRKTGEGSRGEEWKMAGKMSMGARMEVAEPGREVELLWASGQMGGRYRQERAQQGPAQLGEDWEVFSRRSSSASRAPLRGGEEHG